MPGIDLKKGPEVERDLGARDEVEKLSALILTKFTDIDANKNGLVEPLEAARASVKPQSFPDEQAATLLFRFNRELAGKSSDGPGTSIGVSVQDLVQTIKQPQITPPGHRELQFTAGDLMTGVMSETASRIGHTTMVNLLKENFAKYDIDKDGQISSKDAKDAIGTLDLKSGERALLVALCRNIGELKQFSNDVSQENVLDCLTVSDLEKMEKLIESYTADPEVANTILANDQLLTPAERTEKLTQLVTVSKLNENWHDQMNLQREARKVAEN